MEHKILRLSQEKLAKCEALISGKPDYAAEGITSFDTVESWTVDFGGGMEMDVKVCAAYAEQNDPLWTEAVLFENGAECCCTAVFDRLVGDFQCMGDDGKTYAVTVLPEGDLTIKDASQLLDPSKFFLEEDDELDVGYDKELPPLSAHVDYPLPTVSFDTAATFGVEFHTGPKGDTPWDEACEYPLPQLKACIRWLPETGKVALFVIYEGETCDDLFRVALSDGENHRLRELLFAKAKEVYDKTPAEEWEAFLASQQGTI